MRRILAGGTLSLFVVLHAAASQAHPMPPRCWPGDPRCSGNDNLLIAVDRRPLPPPPPPPAPSPPPPAALVSWTSGPATLPWTPSVVVGPSTLLTRHFAAFGFDIGVGIRHFTLFDPNPSTHGTALAFATLGLGALPSGALLGNEMGLDLTSRVYWLSANELVNETALRPAFRVQTAGSRISLPSVLGTFLPAVGFATLSTEETEPHGSLAPRYEGLLLRWAFGLRFVVIDTPVLVIAELEPSLDVIIPMNGISPQPMGGISLNVGFTPMQN